MREETRNPVDVVTAAVASCLGIGYFPVAPATACSLVVTAAIWLSGILEGPHLYWLAPVLLVVAVVTSWRAEAFYGHDGSRIVIDEVVGQTVTLMGHPATAPTFIVGFLLFRFFDVLKPFPVGRTQRLRGGAGVVADDLAAGIYANLALWILLAVFWPARPA